MNLGVVKLTRIAVFPDSIRQLTRSGEFSTKQALIITVHTPVVVFGTTSCSTYERIQKLATNWVFTVSWRRLRYLPIWFLVLRFIHVKVDK
jgi:hypothetical protein